MAITYPLTLPSVTGFKTMGWSPRAVVGVQSSIYTLSSQAHAWPGQAWAINVTLPPMGRVKAEYWISWRLALNGREGTFLLGDPDGRTPRGTVAASGIAIDGAHTARSRTLALKGMVAGSTILAGDYLQLGSGSSARLHKVLMDVTANGSGKVTIDIWPRLRTAYSDSAVVITVNTGGLFRMSSNTMPWTSDEAAYGMSFEAEECL